jgi:hypothetical protein
MSTTILAVDLGKFNSVLVWYGPETRAVAFRTVKTSHEELCRELTRQPVAQVVFEACSQAGWVHISARSGNFPRSSPARPGPRGSGSASNGRRTATTH